MQITVNVPDELARQVVPEGDDPARLALEALALEGYRARRLSESVVRRMLGFDSRMQVHEFLRQHGVYLNYDLADLEKDREVSEKFLSERRRETAATE
jgi:Uncharacterised protein family (UPF0175)